MPVLSILNSPMTTLTNKNSTVLKQNAYLYKHLVGRYMGPGARSGTGKHRYIFLLYQSSGQVNEEKKFDDVSQRRKFPLTKFVADNHLQLLDVTFFTINISVPENRHFLEFSNFQILNFFH